MIAEWVTTISWWVGIFLFSCFVLYVGVRLIAKAIIRAIKESKYDD